MTPVEDVSGGPCGWCRTTHPSGAECVTDPLTFPRPTEEETPMSEHVANGCHCEEPDEQEPLDREELEEAIECIDDERVRSALHGALAELDYWHSREHRQEYVFVRPGEDPSKPPAIVPRIYATPEMVAAFDADPDAHSVGGVPWVRTVTTSRWERHNPAPF